MLSKFLLSFFINHKTLNILLMLFISFCGFLWVLQKNYQEHAGEGEQLNEQLNKNKEGKSFRSVLSALWVLFKNFLSCINETKSWRSFWQECIFLLGTKAKHDFFLWTQRNIAKVDPDQKMLFLWLKNRFSRSSVGNGTTKFHFLLHENYPDA